MRLYELTCNDGDWGWGKTGQQSLMCAENEDFVKQHIPGGWSYKDCGETKETFYLKHIIQGYREEV